MTISSNFLAKTNPATFDVMLKYIESIVQNDDIPKLGKRTDKQAAPTPSKLKNCHDENRLNKYYYYSLLIAETSAFDLQTMKDDKDRHKCT